MTDVMIWDPLEKMLLGIAIANAFLYFLLYLNKGRDRDDSKEKIVFYGFTSLGVGLASSLIIGFYIHLRLPGYFINLTFYGDMFYTNWELEILRRLWLICYMSGFILFFYAYEINQKRTKFILTIIQVSLIILIFISPYNVLDPRDPVSFIGFNYASLLSYIILLQYTKWSSNEHKIIALFMFLSFILVGKGISYSLPEINSLNVIPLFISPLFLILGFIMGIIPLLFTPSNYSHTYFYWRLFVYIYIIFGLIEFVAFLFMGIPINTVIALVFSIFISIYMLFYTNKKLKPQFLGIIASVDEKEGPDILSMLARPQRITEEEVSVSKEKKICIVCKGKIGRNNIYLCPDCDTFYCLKCSNTLTTLENACWVCCAPLDPLKPVKLYKKEEDDFIKDISFEKSKE